MASGISASADYFMTATGLTPGDGYECSVVWTPDDGSVGVNTGFSEQRVRRTGTITFGDDVNALANGSDRPGVLKGWLRLPGSGFNGAPITLDSGPAVTELHIP